MFGSSVAGGITQTDTATWNVKSDFSGDYNDLNNQPDLGIYVDTTSTISWDKDDTNEIQNFFVSATGDTLFLSAGNWIIIPGISAANISQNTSPTASFTISPTLGTTDTIFTFDASACTDNEDATANLQVLWDWENDDNYDTEFSTTKIITHQYASDATYTVKLQVKDTEGLTDSTTITVTVSSGDTSAVTDIDGNVYQTVVIGSQIWMAENLKTTHYADGTAIPLVTDNTAWANLADNNTDDAYCYYNNNASNEADTYGALYTWAAAMGDNAVSSSSNPSGVQGVCPDGWHLPSDAEWTELTDYIANDGHSGAEGTALKATSGWNSDGNGTDNYGFSALPGGYHSGHNGLFSNVGNVGYWWSSTENISSSAYRRALVYYAANVSRGSYDKSSGWSVRCIQDAEPQGENLPPTTPTSPNPANSATGQSLNPALQWACSDPEGDAITYDVYLDSIDASNLVSVGQADTVYSASDLVFSATYYWKIVAKDANGNETTGNVWSFTTLADTSAVTDIDGNVYQTVVIGNQTWMAENLRTTHYADGMSIPKVEGTTEWDNLTETDKAYCWYDNDSISNAGTYGSLYTWAAIMNGAASSDANPSGVQGVCPDGWHLPSDAEWTELTDYLTNNGYGYEGSGNDIGKSMASTSGWNTYGTASTVGNDQASNNSSGFTALPAGLRSFVGSFADLGSHAFFWSATETSSSNVWRRYLDYGNPYLVRDNDYKANGFSARCIRDTEPQGENLPPTTPTSPNPSNSATDQSVNPALQWACSDPEGDAITYDVYLDSIDASNLVSVGQADTVYSASGLAFSATYYWKIVAKDANGNETTGDVWSFTTLADTSAVTDIDGNVYQTIEIGSQIWMAENLRTTHYADGTELVDGTAAGDIRGDYTTKYYFWYDDDSATYADTYGALYTWAAVMNGAASSDANPSGIQGVCPTGWHMPSDDEWKELEMFLGMSQEQADSTDWRGTDEGGKLKEAGLDHWSSPNTGATNESGFTALPGGNRQYDSGTGAFLGNRVFFWSAIRRPLALSRGAEACTMITPMYSVMITAERITGSRSGA